MKKKIMALFGAILFCDLPVRRRLRTRRNSAEYGKDRYNRRNGR